MYVHLHFVERERESFHGPVSQYLLLELQPKFMEKFLSLLEDCEDLENMEDIYILSNIMRMISRPFFK